MSALGTDGPAGRHRIAADYPPRDTDAPGLLARTVLDEQVSRSRQLDPSWPTRVWLGPLLAVVALIVVTGVVGAALLPHVGTARTGVAVALSVLAEAGLFAAAYGFARPVARREGGVATAFGAGWVIRQDWAPWGIGLGMVFVSRLVVVAVANALTGGRAAAQSSNLQLAHPTVAKLIALAVLAVLLAPLTEELLFRGILLRAVMRRTSFWPAAVVSTVVFAGLHAYEVRTVIGAITLVAVIGTLGLTNCYLVRITGRLAPGVLVHATFNLAAVLVLAAHLHR